MEHIFNDMQVDEIQCDMTVMKRLSKTNKHYLQWMNCMNLGLH